MSRITEKCDVQDQLINFLTGIGWTFIERFELPAWRATSDREPFLTDVLHVQLARLNGWSQDDPRIADVVRRLRLLPATLEGNERFVSALPVTLIENKSPKLLDPGQEGFDQVQKTYTANIPEFIKYPVPFAICATRLEYGATWNPSLNAFYERPSAWTPPAPRAAATCRNCWKTTRAASSSPRFTSLRRCPKKFGHATQRGPAGG